MSVPILNWMTCLPLMLDPEVVKRYLSFRDIVYIVCCGTELKKYFGSFSLYPHICSETRRPGSGLQNKVILHEPRRSVQKTRAAILSQKIPKGSSVYMGLPPHFHWVLEILPKASARLPLQSSRNGRGRGRSSAFTLKGFNLSFS